MNFYVGGLDLHAIVTKISRSIMIVSLTASCDVRCCANSTGERENKLNLFDDLSLWRGLDEPPFSV